MPILIKINFCFRNQENLKKNAKKERIKYIVKATKEMTIIPLLIALDLDRMQSFLRQFYYRYS